MIKIGHASGTEKGTAKNGVAGDQTGKEVCVRAWYSKPWQYVLRAKRPEIAEKMAVACEKGCANNHIGYDQNQRNTAHTQAKSVGYDLSKITVDCETDCSAFMTLCAISAGITQLEYTGNAPTTSTMKNVFLATKEFELLTDSKYLNSDAYLRRGDILVKPASHTAMALENGAKQTVEKVVVEPNSIYYPRYTGASSSLVDGLKAVGVSNPSPEFRAKLAQKNDVFGYTRTPAQNTKLLQLLKQGKLKKV